MKLGQVAHAANYQRLQEACVRYGLPVPGRASTARAAARKLAKNGPRVRPGKFADEAAVRRALDNFTTKNAALIEIGVTPTGKNYDMLDREALRLGYPALPARKTGPTKIPRTPSNPEQRNRAAAEAMSAEDLAGVRDLSQSDTDLLRRLKLKPYHFNYRWLRALLEERQLRPLAKRRGGGVPNDQFFVAGKRRSSESLKRRIRDGHLIPHDRCASCRIDSAWNGRALTLQLDHINGDHADNRLENLRFLCPNCHSQTDSYNKPHHLRAA